MVVKLTRTLCISALVAAVLFTAPTASVDAFTASAGGYVCIDSEETAGAPPPYSWETVSTAGPVGDDTGSTVTLPFTFNLFGTAYTSVWICTNGFLLFGGTTYVDWVNSTLPYWSVSTTPNSAICVRWDDWVPAAGAITYGTLGTAPNQRFVVTWTAVPHFSDGTVATFQVILYEGGTADTIKCQYGASTGTGSSGTSCTVGIESPTGAFNQYLFNGTPSTNTLYSGLAVAFYPVTSGPPWSGGGGGGGGGGSGTGSGFGPGGASRDNDNGDQGLNDLFCSSSAGTAGSVLWLAALVLAAAAAALRR